MRSDRQLDVFRDSPRAQAAAFREAAKTALIDPFWTEQQREQRAKHYLAEAERLENQRG